MLSRVFILFYVLVICIVTGFALSTHRPIPPNAQILVDHTNSIYYSPVYIEQYHPERLASLEEARLADIQNSDIQPDEDCWNLGCFVEYPISINRALLEYTGIIETRPSRWTEDGKWNY